MNLSSLIFINLGWVSFMEPGVLSNTQHNITWLIGWLNSGSPMSSESFGGLISLIFLSTLYSCFISASLSQNEVTWKNTLNHLVVKVFLFLFNLLLGVVVNIHYNFELTFSLHESGHPRSLIVMLMVFSISFLFMKSFMFVLGGGRTPSWLMFFHSFMGTLVLSFSAFLLGIELTSPLVVIWLISPFSAEEVIKHGIESSEGLGASLKESISTLNIPSENPSSINWKLVGLGVVVVILLLGTGYYIYTSGGSGSSGGSSSKTLSSAVSEGLASTSYTPWVSNQYSQFIIQEWGEMFPNMFKAMHLGLNKMESGQISQGMQATSRAFSVAKEIWEQMSATYGAENSLWKEAPLPPVNGPYGSNGIWTLEEFLQQGYDAVSKHVK